MDEHKQEHLEERQQRLREEHDHRCVVTAIPGDHEPEEAAPAGDAATIEGHDERTSQP
ncbi:MAG: hypothetical protein R3B09_06255 [Nannocystaceae bacterium]